MSNDICYTGAGPEILEILEFSHGKAEGAEKLKGLFRRRCAKN